MDEKAVFPKYRFIIGSLAILSMALINVQNTVFVPISTFVAEHFSVDIITAGYVRTIVTLISGIASMGFASSFVQKFGAKKTMIIAFSLSLAGALTDVFAPNFIVFLCGRAFAGAATGIVSATVMVIFTMWFPDREKSVVITVYTLASAAAVMALYLSIMKIFSAAGSTIKGICWILAALSALFVLLWIILGRENKAYTEFLKSKVQENSSDTASVQKKENAMLTVLKNRNVLCFMGFVSCLLLCTNGVSTYLSSFFMSVKGFSAEQSANIVSFQSMGSIVGMIAIGAITSVIKSKKIIVNICVAVSVAMLGIMLSMNSIPSIIVSLAVYGAISGSVYIPVQTMIAEMGTELGPAGIAAAYSVIFGAGNLLSFFLPVLLSAIAAAFGFGGAMYSFMGVMVIALVFSLMLKTQKKE